MSKIWASRPSCAVRAYRRIRCCCYYKARRPEDRPRLTRDDFAEHVGRMTNHQRSKWGKAGYPGLRHREVEPLWAFVSPPIVIAPEKPKRSRRKA